MLKPRLIERIRNDGPLPFDVFMSLALYDPDDGFFGSGPVRSTKSGDFLTSPEVSPWFGRMLARFVETGSEGDVEVVEIGAGSGSLLTSLVEDIGVPAPRLHAVEASPAARRALQDLPGVSVHASLDELDCPMRAVFIANELLDNLPVRLAVGSGDSWEERYVGEDGGELVLVAAPVRPDTARWLEKYAGSLPTGGMVEVQLEAQALVERLVGCLTSGAVVLIDYGGSTEELEPRRTMGTLRTYRNHHLGPDPLLEPGQTDITVDVNFSAMAAAATAAGASVTVMRQDDFLAELGLRDILSELRRRELDLARGDDAMARLVVRSEIKDAETLLHPRGLGDFRVLIARVGRLGTRPGPGSVE